MNAAETLQLEQIREGQNRVHHLVKELDHRIDVLARDLQAESLRREPQARGAVPPPLPRIGLVESSVAAPVQTVAAPSREQVRLASIAAQAPRANLRADDEPPTRTPQAPIPVLPADEPSNTVEPIELRVGTFWMARVGIVILLTGLVFLGNYAYHRIVPLLGPWGKLSLLALAGGALTGAGVWLERSSGALRNYGRVLLAGGVAALYYTAYAAHFVAPLRVIESPVVGGTLLLGLAAGIIWFAERRRSETVALLTILLSYYTSGINAVGGFTLFSNLLLTAAAVFFLVRYRWTRLSFASLVATYGSYAFWSFHHFAEFGAASGSFGMGPAFLAGYWVLFTSAVFLAAPGVLSSAQRIAFIAANNGALFILGAQHYAVHRPGEFLLFSIALGAVLLSLAGLARKLRDEDSALSGAYLAQGLMAVTLGLVMRLTGPELALVLAVESAVLLASIRLRHRVLCEVASGLCAVGAFGVALDRVDSGTAASLALGLSVSAMLLFNSWLVKYLRGEWQNRFFSGRSFAFAVLGLLLIGVTAWRETPVPWQPAILALVALAGLGATRVRMFEIALSAQVFAVVGAVMMCLRCMNGLPSPWWTPLPVLLVPLALMHWWQRSSVDGLKSFSSAAQLAFASMAIGVALSWTHAFHRSDSWIVATSALGVISLAYGLVTRSWAIAIAGQFASVLAVCAFGQELVDGRPHWLAALSPVLALCCIGIIVPRFAPLRWPAPPTWAVFDLLGQCYALLAWLLFAFWAGKYVPAGWQVVFYAGVGAAQIFIGSLQHARQQVISGVAYAAFGMTLFFSSRMGAPVSWFDLIAILAVPAGVRWGERFADRQMLATVVRHAVVSGALLSVWMWVSRFTIQLGYAGQLTAAWALLALLVFAAGLSLRDRIYRFGGFAILGLAVVRLFAVDVWRFDTLYRIISFLVLGAVLLLLSFVYSRFAETFRRWL